MDKNPHPLEDEVETAIRKYFRPRPDMTKADLDDGYDPHGDNDV